MAQGQIHRYVEPFVGGGAVFFHIAQHYNIDEYILCDYNRDLIVAYRTIKKAVEPIISLLSEMEKKHLEQAEENRKANYYNIRSEYNARGKEMDFDKYNQNWIIRTAEMIFLNRTCFNGLYRVNSKKEFNVPFGRYKNPTICNAINLRKVSHVLRSITIIQGDFEDTEEYIDNNTFVYFDPPYRPISETANFTSYARTDFDDQEQLRLARYYNRLDKKGAKLILSNSDPKNVNLDDNFFESAYEDFIIKRVQAHRMINSAADKRGLINELLIMNFTVS